jgi:hypothetical protein
MDTTSILGELKRQRDALDAAIAALGGTQTGRKHLVVVLALVLIALTGRAQAEDDKVNPAPINWWTFSDQTADDMGATIQRLQSETGQQVRISDIQVTGKTNFTVTYVQNVGSYGKQWWWFPQISDVDLSKALTTNNARLVSLRAYDIGGGNIRYAAVMISNSGADNKGWWWGANIKPDDVKSLMQQRNARLTALQSYEVNGQTRYAFIMIANTGRDQRAWWWFPNLSPQSIGQALTSNKAFLLDLTPAGNGNFNAVMESCSDHCPNQQWYFGQSGDQIFAEAQHNGSRIVTAESYPGCGSYCFAAVMMQGSPGLGHGSFVSWSGGSRPLDLVWPTNGNGRLLAYSGVDRNGIPFNPRWFPQIADSDVRPDFPGSCFQGGVFVPSRCTTQHPLLDLFVLNTGDPNEVVGRVGGLCSGLMDGHINWRLATYTGRIYFDDWSKSDITNLDLQDDDYNFSLVHPGLSGLTSTDIGNENIAPVPAVLMEFNSDETTPRWGSPWWKLYRTYVEAGLPGGQPAASHLEINGYVAVVTGLLGLDGVHNGYTELHPVYSMAIHLLPDSPPVPDAKGLYHIVQHWVFFIRNYGNEGNCSSAKHRWQAAFKDSSGRGIYYIQLPWPDTKDGTPAPVGASVTPGKGTTVWGWEHGASYSVEADPGYWTYLRFDLPNSADDVGADGEVYLEYTLGRVPANPVVSPQVQLRPGEKRTAMETEIDWNEIQKHVTDPGVRERFLRALQQNKSAVAPSNGEPMAGDTNVAIYRPGASEVAGEAQDRVTIDPIKEKRAADVKALLPMVHH